MKLIRWRKPRLRLTRKGLRLSGGGERAGMWRHRGSRHRRRCSGGADIQAPVSQVDRVR